MDHDHNFKNLILDYPYDALELFAPSEADNVRQGARITPIREEQLKNRLGDRFRELDVPLLVEWANGERAGIAFAIEEETDPQRFSIHRLAHYCLDLAELYTMDRVVPVVVFLHAGSFPRELVLGTRKRTYLRFEFVSCALAELPFERYRGSTNVVARLNLPNMRYAPDERVDVYADALRGLNALETDPNKKAKYIDFIDIYAALDETEQRLYVQKYPQEAEVMSSFAERFRQEGMQQGRQEGMQQGRQEGIQQGRQEGMQQGRQEGMQQGEAQILMRLLARKFGELPVDIRHRVESADSERLLLWSERVLTATSLDEVLQ